MHSIRSIFPVSRISSEERLNCARTVCADYESRKLTFEKRMSSKAELSAANRGISLLLTECKNDRDMPIDLYISLFFSLSAFRYHLRRVAVSGGRLSAQFLASRESAVVRDTTRTIRTRSPARMLSSRQRDRKKSSWKASAFHWETGRVSLSWRLFLAP